VLARHLQELLDQPALGGQLQAFPGCGTAAGHPELVEALLVIEQRGTGQVLLPEVELVPGQAGADLVDAGLTWYGLATASPKMVFCLAATPARKSSPKAASTSFRLLAALKRAWSALAS
jgi:hypothetical protein